MSKLHYFGLKAAVERNDINKVRRLLKQDATPTDVSLIELAIAKDYIEILKLLVWRSKVHFDHILRNIIFEYENFEDTKKLLIPIVKHLPNIRGYIFYELKYRKCTFPLETLKLLLDYGLDIDSIICIDFDDYYDAAAPIHDSIMLGKIDFFKLLIERGADLNVNNTRRYCAWCGSSLQQRYYGRNAS